MINNMLCRRLPTDPTCLGNRAVDPLVSRRCRWFAERGVTLVELLAVIAIIAILTTIAYPIYLDKIREARRVDAKSLVLKAANREEQLYSAKNQYLGSMSALGLPSQTENGAYNVSVTTTGANDQGYKITATAIGDQTNDTCNVFTLDNKGIKTATDTSQSNAQAGNATGQCW